MFWSAYNCNLGVAWLRLLDRIASSGFWSVSSVKWHPYRKWWNFSTAHATARDLISIAMHPLCVSVSALLAKYIGFSSCKRQAPKPLYLCLFVALFLFMDYNRLVQGALIISFLSMANDSSCSGSQLKGTFSFTNSLMGSANSVSLGEILISNLSYQNKWIYLFFWILGVASDYSSDFALCWFVAICCVCFPIEVDFSAFVL